MATAGRIYAAHRNVCMFVGEIEYAPEPPAISGDTHYRFIR